MPAASEICWHSPQGVATLRDISLGIGDLLSSRDDIALSALMHFVPCCTCLQSSVEFLINYHSLSGIVVLSREVNRSGREADYLHLAPRLRMIGAIPLRPLCAFTPSTGTAVPEP